VIALACAQATRSSTAKRLRHHRSHQTVRERAGAAGRARLGQQQRHAPAKEERGALSRSISQPVAASSRNDARDNRLERAAALLAAEEPSATQGHGQLATEDDGMQPLSESIQQASIKYTYRRVGKEVRRSKIRASVRLLQKLVILSTQLPRPPSSASVPSPVLHSTATILCTWNEYAARPFRLGSPA